MKKKPYLILLILFLFMLSNCNGPKIQGNPNEGFSTKIFEVDQQATQDAVVKATQASIATVEKISKDATVTIEVREIATQKAALQTQTADVISEATAQADQMMLLIDELETNGYLQNTTGTYYKLNDFSESRAKIDYYAWYDTGFAPKDFVLNVKINYETASMNSNWENSGCGFVFHDSPEVNHYRIYPALDGSLFFTALLNGEKLVYNQVNYGNPTIPSGEMTLTLIVEGAQIKALINNELFLDEENDLHEAGGLSYSISSGTNLDFGMRCNMTNIELWVLEE
ncbi:MAG: hypothetical protein JEZ06_17490 [Anaerolineaceae bacterium]|nr:hypothetical protein [Anaerolineaceae bacterium]